MCFLCHLLILPAMLLAAAAAAVTEAPSARGKMAQVTPLDAAQMQGIAKQQGRIEETATLFAGSVPTLHLRINSKAIERLRKEPRGYVEAAIEEVGGKTYEHLAIKLKGSDAGSFQPIDRRPGFTINCSKYKGGHPFHGMKRFHLNNSA